MQLENVVGQAQERPFHFDLDSAAEKEPTKAHVFLDHGKDALGLDAAIDPDQLALDCVDPFFHCLPLTGKTLGYIDDLAALCQRFLAAACPDALFFQRTTAAVLAAVNRGLHFKATLRFVLLYTIKGDCLPAGAGVGVRLGVIRHVFTAADVCAVFPRLPLIVVGGLHIQLEFAAYFKPAVILFTLVTGIYADIFMP